MTCKHCFHWDRASETFNTEIQTCCECGYVDTSISRIDKLTQQAVELGFYQQTKDQEAISRVRELHKKNVCNCLNDNCTDDWCFECDDFYPCDTIKALDGANGSSDDVQKVVE